MDRRCVAHHGEDVDEPLERHRRHRPTAGRPALCRPGALREPLASTTSHRAGTTASVLSFSSTRGPTKSSRSAMPGVNRAMRPTSSTTCAREPCGRYWATPMAEPVKPSWPFSRRSSPSSNLWSRHHPAAGRRRPPHRQWEPAAIEETRLRDACVRERPGAPSAAHYAREVEVCRRAFSSRKDALR